MSDFPRYDPAPPPRPQVRERPRAGGALLLVGALIGGVAGGALGATLAGRVDLDPGAGLPDRVTTTGPLPTAPPLPSGSVPPDTARGVADVARAVGPAVVTIVQRSSSGRATGGTGSGFVIDAQRGYVATNSHVVSLQNGAPAPGLDVVFSNGRTVRGQLVGRDPDTDVAVLRVPTGDLTAAVLGNSDEVPIGAAVVAIGSALGEFTNSVTSGVLSGKGRRFESDAQRGIYLEDLVQTDAAISPGNSGGPLIWAATGHVIGMNTLVVRQPGSEGLGFAVSSNTVRRIADELIANGRVERGRIGIAYAIIPPGAGPSIDLPEDVYGVLVQEVQPGSAGAQAGLRAGDVVTKVDGQQIDLEHPLPTIMLRFRPGDRVTLTVFRDGSEQQVGVTLGR